MMSVQTPDKKARQVVYVFHFKNTQKDSAFPHNFAVRCVCVQVVIRVKLHHTRKNLGI